MLAGLLPTQDDEAAEDLDMEESMALINAAFDSQELEESMAAIRQAELELWQRSSQELELGLGLEDSIEFLSAALMAESDRHSERDGNESEDSAKGRKQRKQERKGADSEKGAKEKKTKKSETKTKAKTKASDSERKSGVSSGKSHSRDSQKTPAAAAPPPAAVKSRRAAAGIRQADDGPDSNNGGVYRSCVIGSALFAALKEMSESLPGSFQGNRKQQEEARKAILAHFDRCMEEQIAHVTSGGGGGGVGAAAAGSASNSASALAGASVAYNSKDGSAKNSSTSASSSSSSSSSNAAAAAAAAAASVGHAAARVTPPSVKLPSLRATVAAYGCHGGLWSIQCEDATFSTGPRSRTLTIPRLELWFKARDRKRSRRSGLAAAAGYDTAPASSAGAGAGTGAGAGATSGRVKRARRSQ